MLPSLSFLGDATSQQSEISDIGVIRVPVTGGRVPPKKRLTGVPKPRRGMSHGTDPKLSLSSQEEEYLDDSQVALTNDSLKLQAQNANFIGTVTFSYHYPSTPLFVRLFWRPDITYRVSVKEDAVNGTYILYFTETGKIYKAFNVEYRPMWPDIASHLLSEFKTVDGEWSVTALQTTYAPNPQLTPGSKWIGVLKSSESLNRLRQQ